MYAARLLEAMSLRSSANLDALERAIAEVAAMSK